MADQSSERRSFTPMEILTARFFGGKTLDVADFAKRYALSESYVQSIFSGKQKFLAQAIRVALARETDMSVDFIHGLCNKYLHS